MMGTAKYLSPEQVRGRKLDGRADLYSLGLVLYECLAGRVPFVGASDADTALARLQRDPTDLARLRPTLAPGVVGLIHQLLSRNPNRRPPTGAALRSALQRVAGEQTAALADIKATPAPGRVASPVGPVSGRTRAIIGEATAPQPPGTAQLYDQGGPDHTPTAGPALRGRPARDMQTRFAPSLVLICLLLAVGLVVALILWAAIRPADPRGSRDASASTTAAAQGLAPGAMPTTTGSATAPGASRFTAIDVFDPAGDGRENDELASLALADDNPATNWITECYSNQYTGKPGVGIVATLSTPAQGRVAFEVDTAPFQIEVFTTTDANAPTTLAGWGSRVDRVVGTAPGSVEVTLEQPASLVLLWFVEIGVDPGCSGDTPHRGSIGELSFTPA
jgi:hypothetical protein